jgi:hypothetical protein
MKYLTLTKHLIVLAFVALTFSACDKADATAPLGDQGTTFVKILGGGSGTPTASVVKKPIDFLPTPTKLLVVELRRDIANESELNKTMVVTVKDDTAAVSKAGYLQLPISWYTLQSSGVKTGGQGGVFTFTFKPGEYSKEIYVTIPDATLFNPSALYGLGYTITSADAGSKIADAKAVVVEIGAKNQYDGIYSIVSGLVTRYTAPGSPAGDALSGSLAGNPDIHLVTVGATTCQIPLPGSTGCLAWAFGSNSNVAGIDGLRASVNTSTNVVTMTSAGNATLTNWAGRVNQYDPATKTFTLAFRWNPTANVREYEVILKYKAPR